MSQHEIEIRCACFIANLEGRKHIGTTGYNNPPFIEDLDRRLRFIEIRNESATVTPTQAPTWESLAWRICRLDKPSKPAVPKTLTRSFFGSLLPETVDVNLDTLVRIVGDLLAKLSAGVPLGPLSPPGQVQMQPLPKLVDDEEKLDIIRQRLFFIAGKKQYRVGEVPMSKRDVYILAADLALDAEPGMNGPLAMTTPPPGWGGRATARPFGKPGKKACCGCCTCSCHPSSNRRGVDVINVHRQSKLKKFFKFGWLKSLACWRKKKAYDTSSSSSGSIRSF